MRSSPRRRDSSARDSAICAAVLLDREVCMRPTPARPPRARAAAVRQLRARLLAEAVAGRGGVLVAAPADDLAVLEGPVLRAAGVSHPLAGRLHGELVAQVVEDVIAGGDEVERLEAVEVGGL